MDLCLKKKLVRIVLYFILFLKMVFKKQWLNSIINFKKYFFSFKNRKMFLNHKINKVFIFRK